jgi:hypothetical protein
VSCDLGAPGGLVFEPLLLVTYASPVSDIITSAGFGFHQYADDTQIYFAMRSAKVNQDFDALRICTERLCYWFLSNDLRLNPDKAEAFLVGTHQQRNDVAIVQSVPVAGADLPIMSE